MRILLYYVRSIFKRKFDVEVLNGTVIRLEPFKTYIVESFNNELGLKIFTVRISYQGYELIIRVDEENLTRLIKAKID
ncbi:hypothetical protein NYY92_15300 [Acinetobacter baumannii]|nr:hypothetical protein [Acinetobacter baumannii]